MKRYVLAFTGMLCAITSGAQSNYALTFNGTNQYVSVGAPLTGSSYTKEAWIYITSNTGSRNIISSVTAPFWLNAGVLTAGNNTTNLVADASALPLNTWIYAAVTYDAPTSTMKLYRNGDLVSTATSVPAYTVQSTFIGSNDGSSNYFLGSIDEVRIWNTVLTQPQLKQNMFKGPATNASGLAEYFKANEGSGTTLTNATGGTNGTLQNAPTWTASPIQYAKNGIKFDGTDDNIVIPQVINSDFTIEYYVSTTATASTGQWYNGSGIVDAEMPGGTNDFGTALVGAKFGFGIGNPDNTIISTTSINTGAWFHVAATWQQSTGAMKLYVNGVLEASGTGGTAARTAPTRITFGEMQTAVSFFNGAIDEVRIWNTVRTQAQISANMSKGVNPTAEPTLVAYYTFDQGVTGGTNSGLTIVPDMKSANNGTMNNFTMSGTSSNYVTQPAALQPLALDWLSFTANYQDHKVLLQWSTANEKNTNSFIIQHSSDSKIWNDIGTVAAAGSSLATRTYTYTDIAPQNGNNYYRILQTDIDGSSSYSVVRNISIDADSQGPVVTGNPVVNGTLQIRSDVPCSFSLYNSNGQQVWHQAETSGNISVDMSTYPKGIYLLRAGNHTEKVVLP